MTDGYDPFLRGRFPVGVRAIQAQDGARGRRFPCEVWYPAAARHAGQDLTPETQDVFTVPSVETPRRQSAVRNAEARPGTYPLIVFSHGTARWRRLMSTFLCTHLTSHGYVVASMDHSEVVAAELAPLAGESSEQRRARAEAWIASRVPDIRFLLDHLLGAPACGPDVCFDSTRIGIAGYSFGGWTALAAADADRRIRCAVALAPGGGSRPRPGILPVRLEFSGGRDVPALYLAAENDTMIPLSGLRELFERTPGTKWMVILRRADHAHFLDEVEEEHEAVRAMPFTGELAWIPKEMRPAAALCSGDQANLFVRGLTLCHMDAALRRQEGARRFLLGDVEAALKARGVGAMVCRT